MRAIHAKAKLRLDLATRGPILALLGVTGLFVSACGGEPGAETGGEGVAAAEEALSTVCTTLQRSPTVAVQDAQVSRDLSDPTVQFSNFGAASAIASSRFPTRLDRSLLQFDLASIPAGTLLTSADLSVQAASSGNALVQVRRVTAPWAENTVTWVSSAGNIDPTVHAATPNGGAGYVGPLSFDVTALAQDWLDGTFPNDGMVLGQSSNSTVMESSEAAAAMPSLTLCYLAPVCGDGQVDPGETCDDGNTQSGDGCAMNCQLEVCPAGSTEIVVSATGLPLAITDFSTAVSSISIPSGGAVVTAVLGLDIIHTYDADLDISLASPSGPTLDISSDNGSSADNYTGTTFSSACAAPVASGAAPFAGCYAPEQSLAAFAGQPSVGTWTLSVYDDTGGDTGSLVGWSLTLCVQ